MNHLSILAEFISTAAPSKEAIDKTALILADSVGAIVGGAAEPEVAALSAQQQSASHGQAVIIGTGTFAAAGAAAFLNGTAGTSLEMDEGNQFCKGHPAMHVVPAALAEAAHRNSSGHALLTAITVGYEAAARVGIATSLRPSMHPHGTWGAIGAVAAVLRLRSASGEEIRNGMNIAANLGLTTSRRTMLEGGTVRNVFAGVSNQMGLLAADLVSSGYSGDTYGVNHVFGKVASDNFDADKLVAHLGRRWEVERNYFKMHSCCRYNHAALDALEQLRHDTPGLTADAVAQVEVETYGLAIELDDPAPRNVLAAKFSVPFALATALVQGSSGVSSFTQDKVEDRKTLDLAARVSITEDPMMSAQLPDMRPARVTLHMHDGTTLRAETQTNRGDYADPYSDEEIKTKYQSLTARLWTPEQAEAAWDAIMELDSATDLGALLETLKAT